MSKVKLLKQYKPFATEHWRYKCVYGGRGKGATWLYARLLLLRSMEDKLRMLCTREFQNSIAESVYHVLASQIDLLELRGFRVKEHEIISPEGGQFIFKGLKRNIDSIKSTEGIDICWVAEADKVPQDSWDKLIPTIRKENSEIWIDFNTDQEDDPIYNMLVNNPRPDALVMFQNYKDNPEFPDVLRAEMEYCKETDYEKYTWVWEGKTRSFSESCIYHGKWREDDFTTPKDAEFFHGIDWGFATDPTAAIRCFVKDQRLFIDRECGGVGIEINDLPELFNQIPTLRMWTSRADSARPELVSYCFNHGYPRMRSAKKGPGSIEDGITKIRGFKEIIVHPRCVMTIDELKSYKYKRNALTNEILPIPEKKNDHFLDALRYSLEPLNKIRAKVGDKRIIGL